MKKDILDKISASEAQSILKQIAGEDEGLRKRIIELAEDLLRDVDVKEYINTKKTPDQNSKIGRKMCRERALDAF